MPSRLTVRKKSWKDQHDITLFGLAICNRRFVLRVLVFTVEHQCSLDCDRNIYPFLAKAISGLYKAEVI